MSQPFPNSTMAAVHWLLTVEVVNIAEHMSNRRSQVYGKHSDVLSAMIWGLPYCRAIAR